MRSDKSHPATFARFLTSNNSIETKLTIATEDDMKIKTTFLSVAACFYLLTTAVAQNVEVTAHVGGQINGGLDLSTTIFHRIEVGNGLSYGVTAGYLLGEHYGLEFQWNKDEAATRAQPIGGGSSIKVFNLGQNQYM